MREVALVSWDADLADEVLESQDPKIIGVFDREEPANSFGIPYLGPDDNFIRFRELHPGCKILLAIDPPELRKRLSESYGLSTIATFKSGSAYLSRRSKVGEGVILQRGVRVLADATIGSYCKVNVGAQIHHGVQVGPFSTLAPSCLLLGNVAVGEMSYVGAGAIVLPRVRIGNRCTIGAGAVVTRDVPPNSIVKGVPGRWA